MSSVARLSSDVVCTLEDEHVWVAGDHGMAGSVGVERLVSEGDDLGATGREVVGFEGQTVTDPSKPDATLRKRMSAAKPGAIGWPPRFAMGSPLPIGISSPCLAAKPER